MARYALKTIKIKRKDDDFECLVNATDFDEEKHTLIEGEPEAAVSDEPEKWAIGAIMDGKIVYWTGDEFDGDEEAAKIYRDESYARSALSRTGAIQALIEEGTIEDCEETKI